MIKRIETLFLHKETSLVLLLLYSFFLLVAFLIPVDMLTNAFIIFMGSTFFGIVGLYYSSCIEVIITSKFYSTLYSLLLVLYLIFFLYTPTLFQDQLTWIVIQTGALIELVLIKNVLQVYLNSVTLEN